MGTSMKSEILEKAYELKNQLITWRRDFHQHPELGFEEVRTSKIVAEHLESLGIETTRNIGKTGVVGLIKGKSEGPTIALRADMDALPMEDRKTVDYRSKVPGKAHACGHDAHTSMLMGAAKVLAEMGGPEKGNIKFIFQPAEEGLGGAPAMIEDGVLSNPTVNRIAGLHIDPMLPSGTLAVVRNQAMAAADTFEVKIIGVGGHAARPHQTVDSITVASEVISALQHVVSRQIDPLDPAVLTIGKIEGGSAYNIIAPEVTFIGTVRTLNPEVREAMPNKMESIIKGVTEAFGANYEFNYDMGYPSVINDDQMVDLLDQTAKELVGDSNFNYIKPSMGGEDFSYYTKHIPGVFFRLGASKDGSYPLHHPLFDINDEILPLGSAALVQLALNFLNNETKQHNGGQS
ncbi:M20 family metallopeptidase [Bacillus sp. JJ1503]|uniref:M20 metallopeptidase family protein n=1 Tax=unclassified Bacillus (in: firmicutes) TaxID=185979 RepID=UPI002FFF1390